MPDDGGMPHPWAGGAGRRRGIVTASVSGHSEQRERVGLMRALRSFGHTTVRLVERPEPSITASDEVKVRSCAWESVHRSRGSHGGRAKAPDGQQELVIGHEMFVASSTWASP